MNRNILAIAAALAVSFAVAAPAGAATPEDRAREAASEGPQALRSFVERTRMIYALDIQDFTTVRDDATADAADGGSHDVGEDQLIVEKEHAAFREQLYRDMLHE